VKDRAIRQQKLSCFCSTTESFVILTQPFGQRENGSSLNVEAGAKGLARNLGCQGISEHVSSPRKRGISFLYKAWIPAFTGMTNQDMFRDSLVGEIEPSLPASWTLRPVNF
jgi:hypothetical protein